jgi:hypothetical protein
MEIKIEAFDSGLRSSVAGEFQTRHMEIKIEAFDSGLRSSVAGEFQTTHRALVLERTQGET